MLSKDDKNYLLEELERLKTYAKSKSSYWISEQQYEGWLPKFHKYNDKIKEAVSPKQ